MSKKLKILFIVSLALNVFFVSFIAGQVYRHKGMRHGHGPLLALLDGASIPDEKRAELIAKLGHFSKHKGGMQKLKAWEEKTHAILTAEVFDQDAYRTQLEERFLKSKPYKVDRVYVMVEIAVALNQEERKEMAAILKHRFRRPPR